MILTLIAIWLAINVLFVIWRSFVAAGRADVAPRLIPVRAKR